LIKKFTFLNIFNFGTFRESRLELSNALIKKFTFLIIFNFGTFENRELPNAKKKRILILFECLFLFTKNFDQKVRFIKHFSILELSRIETRELPKLI
jgi:hypothetical protein